MWWFVIWDGCPGSREYWLSYNGIALHVLYIYIYNCWKMSKLNIWLEFGLFSTIIAIIGACPCWALFVVTLTNTVHLIYIYIFIQWQFYSSSGSSLSYVFNHSCCVDCNRVLSTMGVIHQYVLVSGVCGAYKGLIHWGRDKMGDVFQTTFLNVFSWMKMYWYWLKFHWSLFLGIQLTIF